MAPTSSPAIDAFLARVPAAQRAALERLRQTIRAAAPEAEEYIGYGVPAFRYHGRPLVSFGYGKAHLSFYVQSPAVMDTHAADLAKYDTSKGTVRFTAEKPLPVALIKTLVKARMQEIG